MESRNRSDLHMVSEKKSMSPKTQGASFCIECDLSVMIQSVTDFMMRSCRFSNDFFGCSGHSEEIDDNIN